MTMTLYGRLSDIESRYLTIFFYVVGCNSTYSQKSRTTIIRMIMTLYGRLADIEPRYLIIFFMLLDAKVKIIKI